MTLSEFLLARIAEDEHSAMQSWAGGHRGSRWLSDPDRQLAECEAKRQIVALHAGSRICRTCAGDPPIVYGERSRTAMPTAKTMPCPTLRILALPYAEHRDHRDEWKP